MTTALVLDGQLRSALAVVRSLGRRGVTVHCGESTRAATACFSKYVSERVVYPDPERDPERFADFLRRYLETNDVDAVLPVGHETTRLLSRHRSKFAELTALPVPAWELFERAVDKGRTVEAARRAGVPHPRTIRPTGPDDAVDRASDLQFPVVVKPRTGSGSRGLRFVSRPEAFPAVYESVHEAHPLPLVQERIPREGPGLGAAFLRDRDGRIRARFAYRRLREYPPSGGPSTLRVSVDRSDVLEYGERLLTELDWQGVAMVEFKLDPRDDTPKLMEVNPRFWGSLHLPLYAGVDFPWLVLQYALGDDVESTLEYDVGVKCRYFVPGDLLYLATVRDWASLRDFFPLFDPDLHYDILDRDDPGPTLGRLVAMGRYSVSPRMWRKVILRGSGSDVGADDESELSVEQTADGTEIERGQ